ncbi:FAD-dependent monooxygenase [Amycolatopsis sp. cg5]|uniref:FAD-dependent monooxygenase n=1 Tax=Amycolatopsis sp. cg5 TaxID=3238802 RepID=UPI0035233551
MKTDAVIAGGGPVGLMLACELGLSGVDVVVLERTTARPADARAWGLHARTAETLDRRDLLSTLLVGERVAWPKMPFAGMWPLLQLHPVNADHPYLLNVSQIQVEEVLEARARELGVVIKRGHELTGLAQDADGVAVEATGPDGTYNLHTGYLIGCDGGRSTTRKLAGIGFPGTDPTVGGMLCDCTLPTMATEKRGITRTPGGTVNINPRPNGVVRIVTTEFGRPHPDRDAPVTIEEFRAAVGRILGRDLEITDPSFMTRFGDATRQADRYREGRVLLAGDAAHVHFPYGGLGLNLGLQDAANLGWKLAARIQGRAPDSLLDTYHAERHPVAAEVLEYSRTQLALLDPHRNVTALRSLFQHLLDIPEANRYLAELVSGASTRYPSTEDADPLTGRFARDLALKTADGETTLVTLLRQGKPVLLDLAADPAPLTAAGRWADSVHLLAARCDDPPSPALLVRPDGYVAWAGTDTDSLTRTLTSWFGEPTTPVQR